MSEDKQEHIMQLVLHNVEKIRSESQSKLKELLSPTLGTSAADDVAHYFFGPNPQIKNLTWSLLKDLKLVTDVSETKK